MIKIILLVFFVATAAGSLGWFWATSRQRKKNALEQAKLSADHNTVLEKLKQEQQACEELSRAKEHSVEQQSEQLNAAFLTNGRSVESMTTELKSAQEFVTNAFSLLPEIYHSSNRMTETTDRSKAKMDDLSNSVNSWQDSINTLQSIQQLINGIHDKSQQIRDVSAEANLLALNASIEAARAGEHGRGFAVVAECMRDLSNKSEAATLEISSSVEITRSEVTNIITGIEQSVGFLLEVTEAVNSQFGDIESEVNNINDISKKSSVSAQEAQQKFEEINSKVNTQLEGVSKLLADTMGLVTGNRINEVSPNSDLTGMKIIDVRRPDEFNGDLGHIQGAQLICLQDNFENRIHQLNKEQPHLFVCRSGGRSARAARMALANGFKQVYNLEGGMLAWSKRFKSQMAQ
ncbi:MAG: methyl-accepting chemotaxis protein [Methylococcaceae bacterium]